LKKEKIVKKEWLKIDIKKKEKQQLN